MKFVKFLVLVMVLILTTIPLLSGVEASWNQGRGWGYKWEGKVDKGFFNGTFSGYSDGRWVIGMYIEYVGEENGLYNFSYFGSIYGYASVRGSFNGTYGKEDIIIEDRMLWFNFDGYMLMNRTVVLSGNLGIEHEIFGVVKQKIHIYTPEPLDLYHSSRFTTNIGGVDVETNYTYSLRGKYNLTLLLDYSDSVGYIPLDNFTAVEPVIVRYRAHEISNISLKRCINGIWYNTTMRNDTVSEGSLGTSWMIYRDGPRTARPGLIESVPVAFGFLLSSSSQENNVVENLIHAMLMPNTAIYDGSFYSSITVQFPIFGGFVNSTSKQASEEEVREIMTKAPEEYGPEREQWITWLAPVVAIALPLAVISILYLRRRRTRENI